VNDEGFREIQLNGKQLVFLFMAVTVVAVVIFLLGLLVGRGVGPDREPRTEVAAAEIAADPGAKPAEPSPFPLDASTAAPPAAPPPPLDELSYPDRLERATPPQETLKPAPPRVQEPLPAQSAKRAEAKPATAKPSAPPPSPAPAASGPSGPGYAVQVAAPSARPEAEMLVKQLKAKGYPAFVMDPVEGAPVQRYRVRVGKYKTLKEAQEVSNRLKTLEQFDPWIAR
jgi:cell division protein FtsN